jgi:hypothetical protein
VALRLIRYIEQSRLPATRQHLFHCLLHPESLICFSLWSSADAGRFSVACTKRWPHRFGCVRNIILAIVSAVTKCWVYINWMMCCELLDIYHAYSNQSCLFILQNSVFPGRRYRIVATSPCLMEDDHAKNIVDVLQQIPRSSTRFLSLHPHDSSVHLTDSTILPCPYTVQFSNTACSSLLHPFLAFFLSAATHVWGIFLIPCHKYYQVISNQWWPGRGCYGFTGSSWGRSSPGSSVAGVEFACSPSSGLA